MLVVQHSIYIHMRMIAQAAQQSAYRKQLASLARPLDGRTRKRIEFTKLLFETFTKTEAQVRSQADLGKIFETWHPVMGKLVELEGEDDPAAHKLIGLLRASIGSRMGRMELFRTSFFENDFFLITGREGDSYGPILSRHIFFDLPNHVTALAENSSQQHSLYTPRFSVVDTVTLLETVAFIINLYRYHELELSSSLLLTNYERGSPNTVKRAFERRLAVVEKPAGAINEAELYSAIDDLSLREGDQRTNQIVAAMRIYSAHFHALSIADHFDEDPIQHTLNLMNAIAQSLIMIDGFRHSLGIIPGDPQTEAMLVALCNLIPIAFGESNYKLAALYTSGLDPELHGRAAAIQILLQYLIPLIVREAGYQPGQSPKKQAFFLLSRNEKEIREAARAVLNTELIGFAGKPLDSFFDLNEVERVRQTPFIGREHLPLITAFWNAKQEKTQAAN